MPPKKSKKNVSTSLASIGQAEAIERRKKRQAEAAAAKAEQRLQELKSRQQTAIDTMTELQTDGGDSDVDVPITMDERREQLKKMEERADKMRSRSLTKAAIPTIRTYTTRTTSGIRTRAKEEENFVNFLLGVDTTDNLSEDQLNDLLESLEIKYSTMRKTEILKLIEPFSTHIFGRSKKLPKSSIIKQRKSMVNLVSTLPPKYMKEFLIQYLTDVLAGYASTLRVYYKEYIETNEDLKEYIESQVTREDVNMRLDTLLNNLRSYGMVNNVKIGLNRLAREEPEVAYGIQKIFEIKPYDYPIFVYEYEMRDTENFNEFVDNFLSKQADPIETFEGEFIQLLRELLRLYQRKEVQDSIFLSKRRVKLINKTPPRDILVDILEGDEVENKENDEDTIIYGGKVVEIDEDIPYIYVNSDLYLIEGVSINPYKIISKFIERYISYPEIYNNGKLILKKLIKFVPKDEFKKFIENFLTQYDSEDDFKDYVEYFNEYIAKVKLEKKRQRDIKLPSPVDSKKDDKIDIINAEYNRNLEYCKDQLMNPVWIQNTVVNVYIQAVSIDAQQYYTNDVYSLVNDDKNLWYVPNEQFFIDACKSTIGQYQFGDEYFFKSSINRGYVSVKLGFLTDDGEFIIQNNNLFALRVQNARAIAEEKSKKVKELLDSNVIKNLKEMASTKLSYSLHKIAPDEVDYMDKSQFLQKLTEELDQSIDGKNITALEYIRKLATLLVVLDEDTAVSFKSKIEQFEYTPETLAMLMLEEMYPEIFNETNRAQRERNVGIIMDKIIQQTQELEELYFNIETIGSKRTKSRSLYATGADVIIDSENIEEDDNKNFIDKIVNRNTVYQYKKDELVYYKDPDDGMIYAIPKERLINVGIPGGGNLFSSTKPTANPYTGKPMDREFMRWFIQTYYTESPDPEESKIMYASEETKQQIIESAAIAPDFMSNVLKRVKLCINSREEGPCNYLNPREYILDDEGNEETNDEGNGNGMSPELKMDDDITIIDEDEKLQVDEPPLKKRKVKNKTKDGPCCHCGTTTNFLASFKEIEPKQYKLVYFCSFKCLDSHEQPFITEHTSKILEDA